MFWGKGVEQVTNRARWWPLAPLAVPYFSKRKAIDLLGKVDKHVARTTVPASAPPEFRCWRPWPGAGHNKEDLAYSFAARPDVSTVEPPAHYRDLYEKLSHAGLSMWVRRDSELVFIPGAKPR